MRILLTSTASYAPPRGGSARANLVWLRELAARRHQCSVVCGSLSRGEDSHTVLPGGIPVTQRYDLARNTGAVSAAIRAFEPHWIFVSSEDLTHELLREASESLPGRVIYLAHTPQFFPFGPESWSVDPRAAARVRDCAAIVVIGHHMAAFVRQHLEVNPRVVHPNLYGPEPFESFSNFDAGDVLMINPCSVKGISLFTGLAAIMPAVSFAALPGWGTTKEDRKRLCAIPNVSVLEPVERIEDILKRTRVLLMPSLWYEGFGLIVMEAMLHGIPVIASDSGGLREAKQGTGFVIPVAPIRKYDAHFDDVRMPRPVIPPQDLAPWKNALEALLSNRAIYEGEAERSREAALTFVSGLRSDKMEELLVGLPAPAPLSPPALPERLARLSSAQRSAILDKIRSRPPR